MNDAPEFINENFAGVLAVFVVIIGGLLVIGTAFAGHRMHWFFQIAFKLFSACIFSGTCWVLVALAKVQKTDSGTLKVIIGFICGCAIVAVIFANLGH
ncbi:MAG: hypothetical protein GY850_04050 [bacterium]|nr:hypothetical protein [bacterium]